LVCASAPPLAAMAKAKAAARHLILICPLPVILKFTTE
jgi:hypothetical protein